MPAMRATPAKQLYDLLMEIYPSQMDLRRDFRQHELTRALEPELPGEVSSRAHVVQGAVDGLLRRGLAAEPLFKYYLTNNRKHAKEIRRVATAFGVEFGESAVFVLPSAESLPPGTPWSPEHYVRWGKPEKRALRLLRYPGKPVVVYGPPRVGKSWFLRQILHEHVAKGGPGVKAVHIDLDEASIEDRDDYESFLKWLTFCLRRAVAPNAPPVEAIWHGSRHPNTTFTDFLRHHALAGPVAQLVIGLDRADRVRLSSYNDDFFALLRARLTDPGEPWDRIRMVVALSAEPRELTANKNASLFHGLSRPLKLEGFTEEQVIELGGQYELQTTRTSLLDLVSNVKRTPYHLRDALFEAVLDADDD